MWSEVRINGEIGIDDIATGAADAPCVGTLAAQRVDAAGVCAAARDSTEHADVVAAGLPAWVPGPLLVHTLRPAHAVCAVMTKTGGAQDGDAASDGRAENVKVQFHGLVSLLRLPHRPDTP